MRYRWHYIILILSVFIGIQCSSDKPEEDSPLLGSWHYKRKNIYEIMTFRANGTFNAQLRVEGRFSKIIEKKESIEGTYLIDGNQLTMIPNGKLSSGDWKDGNQKSFEIAEVTKDNLSLNDAEGRLRKWDRVGGQQEVKEEISTSMTVGLGPMVVNLKKKQVGRKDRFLCIDLELVLAVKPKEGQVVALHPRVREVTLFYLSSMYYSDVNSLNKITAIKDTLVGLIKPYVKHEIKEISIKNIIVTASTKAVDEFLGTPLSMDEFDSGTGEEVQEAPPSETPPSEVPASDKLPEKESRHT